VFDIRLIVAWADHLYDVLAGSQLHGFRRFRDSQLSLISHPASGNSKL
jgi:hypothetical protein